MKSDNLIKFDSTNYKQFVKIPFKDPLLALENEAPSSSSGRGYHTRATSNQIPLQHNSLFTLLVPFWSWTAVLTPVPSLLTRIPSQSITNSTSPYKVSIF